MNALAIFIGGGLGSLARYGIGLVAARWADGPVPWGTWVANGLATGLLVFITAAASPHLAHLNRSQQALLLLATTGFCGGFSTFSTFSLETLRLIEAGAFGFAALNVLVSVVGCLAIGWSVWRGIGH
jgi:CrcB protein